MSSEISEAVSVEPGHVPASRLRVLAGRMAPVVLVFALGLGLRLYSFDTVPEPYATADEYAWTWSGMTLLNDGTPTAWSWFEAYPNAKLLSWEGAQYRLVHPWLDHPPLYPLFMGVWMRLGGFHDIFAVKTAWMRCSSLLLFVLTFAMLALLYLRTLERPVALASLVVYAILPLAVLQSRLVLSENLLTPIFLVGLYALLRWFDDSRRRWLALLGLCVYLLPLTKTAGLALILALFSLCVHRRRWGAIGIIVVAAGLGVGTHILYGLHQDAHLFRAIMTSQSQRFSGFGTIYKLLFTQKIVTSGTVYLPPVLGALILFSEFLQGRLTVWALVALAYAAGLAFFADQKNVLGWYALPLFPAIAVGIGKFAVDLRENSEGWHLWLWSLFFVAGPLDALLSDHLASKLVLRCVYLGLILLVPLLVAGARQLSRDAYRAGIACLFGVQIMSDVYTVLTH